MVMVPNGRPPLSHSSCACLYRSYRDHSHPFHGKISFLFSHIHYIIPVTTRLVSLSHLSESLLDDHDPRYTMHQFSSGFTLIYVLVVWVYS